MKGVFLGAGASYEVGMPLVLEFSKTLRTNVLKRLDSKLFNFESDPSFKEKFIEILSNESMHYEEVVGELENLYLSDHGAKSPIHGAIIQLVECIQLLLLEEQMNTLKLLGEKVKDYYGIRKLVKEQGVLNVFSLNHDIVFEEICDFYNIPYKDGFFVCESKYDHVANFKSISSSQLESGELDLFKDGGNGVNLIKLHGSLDIFAVEDKHFFLKCYGDGLSVGSHFYEIRKIENHNLEICSNNGVRATNELCAYDSDHELQFLRRSLLSGAHKFQQRFEQIAPIALFEAFKKYLISVDELIVIGYGFCDSHVNDVMCSWLSDASNKITIYDPYREAIPDCLVNNTVQIELVKGGLTDFFLSFDSSKETLVSRTKRKIFDIIREKLRDRRFAC